jgi:hypothetical protein
MIKIAVNSPANCCCLLLLLLLPLLLLLLFILPGVGVQIPNFQTATFVLQHQQLVLKTAVDSSHTFYIAMVSA